MERKIPDNRELAYKASKEKDEGKRTAVGDDNVSVFVDNESD